MYHLLFCTWAKIIWTGGWILPSHNGIFAKKKKKIYVTLLPKYNMKAPMENICSLTLDYVIKLKE
jgi:hypothetical protein